MLWWLPILPMVFAALVFFTGRRRSHRLSLAALGILALLASGGVTIAALNGNWAAKLQWSQFISLQLGLSPVAITTVFLVLGVAIPILLYASVHESSRGLNRLLAGLLFFVGSMLMLVVAEDFLTLLIAWELVGISSWVLIAQQWWHKQSGRDANYAFIATRIGDLGLFLAAAVIFAGSGEFSYGAVDKLDAGSRSLLTAGVVLAAISKSAQLPFSPWLFRAMSGPSSVSALLHAATMVASGAYLLIRLYPHLNVTPWFGPVIFGIGLATALLAGALAVLQVHAKRLAAASTVAQYGFMLVAIGAGYPAVALFHMLAHGTFKATLFLVIGILNHNSGSWQLSAMGLGKQLPFSAAVSGVAVLALAGIPPLGAAWSKEAVTAAAEDLSTVWGLVIILASGITAAYAFRFQLLAFGRKSRPAPASDHRPGGAEKFSLALLTAMSVALSLFWFPSVRTALGTALHARLPPLQLWSLLLSWLAIGAGIYTARVLVMGSAVQTLAEERTKTLDWFGLAKLLDQLVTQPVRGSARFLARLDDQVMDWPTHKAADFVEALCRLLRRADEKILDRSVTGFSAAVLWTARQSRDWTEGIIDGIPEGSSALTGLAGKDARMLQTGLSHQYYLLVCAGLAAVLAVLYLALH